MECGEWLTCRVQANVNGNGKKENATHESEYMKHTTLSIIVHVNEHGLCSILCF